MEKFQTAVIEEKAKFSKEVQTNKIARESINQSQIDLRVKQLRASSQNLTVNAEKFELKIPSFKKNSNEQFDILDAKTVRTARLNIMVQQQSDERVAEKMQPVLSKNEISEAEKAAPSQAERLSESNVLLEPEDQNEGTLIDEISDIAKPAIPQSPVFGKKKARTSGKKKPLVGKTYSPFEDSSQLTRHNSFSFDIATLTENQISDIIIEYEQNMKSEKVQTDLKAYDVGEQEITRDVQSQATLPLYEPNLISNYSQTEQPEGVVIREKPILEEPIIEQEEKQESAEKSESENDEFVLELLQNKEREIREECEQKLKESLLINNRLKQEVENANELLENQKRRYQQLQNYVEKDERIESSIENGVDFSEQYESPKDNVTFLKEKVDELTRRCTEAGLIKTGQKEIYNDFSMLDQSAEKQITISRQKLPQQEPLQQLLPLIDETLPNVDEISSSSLSIDSLIHIDEQRPELQQYIEQRTKDFEAQVQAETCAKEMQTEKIIENFLNFDFEDGDNLKDFVVSKELNKKEEDTIEVYRPNDVVVDNLVLADLPTLDEYAKKSITRVNSVEIVDREIDLEQFKKVIENFGKESDIGTNNSESSLVHEEDTEEKTELIAQQDAIPTFEEYFDKQNALEHRYFYQQKNDNVILQMRHQKQLAMIEDDYSLESAHFELGIASNIRDIEQEIERATSKQRARCPETSKLKPTATKYKLPEASNNNVLMKQQSDIKTYADYYQLIQKDYQTFRILKILKEPLILLHPLVPMYQNANIVLTKSFALETFKVTHAIDKLYFKFRPQKYGNALQIYPSTLRNQSISILYDESNQSSPLSNSIRYFQSEINNLHLISLEQKVDYSSNITSEYGQQLFPVMGESIKYIRLSSICEDETGIPNIFSIIQKISNQEIEIMIINNVKYIEIPLQNVVVKPISQIIKLIRELISERLNSSTTYLQLQKEPESINSDQFEQVEGILTKQQAENLSDFLLLYSKKHYGINILIQTFLWNLIANLLYYKYDNEEIYLFSQFLFDQLPTDFFLMYLDLVDMLGLQNEVSSHHQLILINQLPEIVQKLLRSYESSRQQAFLQSVYALLYEKAKSSKSPPETISFTLFAQLLLFNFAQFRSTCFKSILFIYNNIAKEDETWPSLNYGGFKLLIEMVTGDISYLQVKEMYYAFAGGLDRKLSYERFQDLFQAFELARFCEIESRALDALASSDLKRLVKNFVLFHNNYENLQEKVHELFARSPQNRELLALKWQKVCELTENTECNILVYDFESAVRTAAQAIYEIEQGLLYCKPEGALVMLGGAMNSLNALISEIK